MQYWWGRWWYIINFSFSADIIAWRVFFFAKHLSLKRGHELWGLWGGVKTKGLTPWHLLAPASSISHWNISAHFFVLFSAKTDTWTCLARHLAGPNFAPPLTVPRRASEWRTCENRQRFSPKQGHVSRKLTHFSTMQKQVHEQEEKKEFPNRGVN